MGTSSLLKKPLFQGVLIGAFGGMAPKVIEIIPNLFNNVYPSAGHFLGLTLLAIVGAVIVLIYKEVNLQKALILGAGAPAILATLTAQAVAPSQNAGFIPIQFSIIETAFAQPQPQQAVINLVFKQNDSPYALNKLWIRTERETIHNYNQKGDTLTVTLPTGTKELRITLPEQGQSFTLSGADLSPGKTIELRIVNDQQAKDFWQTFGNKSIPKYKIEKVGSVKE